MTRSATEPRRTTRRVRSSPKRTTFKAAEREVFARNVRAARLAMGWNQTDLGYRIIGTSGYVGDVEAARENVSIDRMAMFARAFGRPLFEFLKADFTISKAVKLPSLAEIVMNRELVMREKPATRRSAPKAAEREVFGENVRAARLARGLSQEKVARSLGFDISTIPPTEAGNVNISIDRMAALAHLLEVPLHQLLNNDYRRRIEPSIEIERKRRMHARGATSIKGSRASPKE